MKYDKVTLSEWVDFSGALQPITLLGLTKREVFAAAALAGHVANPALTHCEASEFARFSVESADALIRALAEAPVKKEGPTS